MATYAKLSEISHFDDLEAQQFTWDFDLPSTVDADRIEVNISKIQRLQRIAHFASSHVLDYQGETTQVTPGIGGINSDGTALATRAVATQKAPKQKTNIIDEFSSQEIMQNNGSVVTFHVLNKAELASRVVDLKRTKALSGEQAWAIELDVALNQSLRQAAREHLIKRQDKAAYFGDLASWALMIGISSQTPIAAPEAPLMLPAYYALMAGPTIVSRRRKDAKQYGDQIKGKHRWTLNFPGSQLEMYGLASATIAAGKTIRAAK